jgi:hypothetical protein
MQKRVALVDPAAVGLGLQVFVMEDIKATTALSV